MTQSGPVAIVGAGIAGLTAALSFACKGIAVDIVDQRPALTEVGAGLQLSPNATRILDRLELASRLEQVWSEPTSVNLVDGASLRTVASVPSGKFARDRWNAPYGVLHRADLQKILLDAVEANPLCRVHLGIRIEGGAREAISGLLGAKPRLVVGADGVWSRLRNEVQGAGKAIFSGNVAWRFTLGEALAPPALDFTKVTAFLGGGAHLVAYPLQRTRNFNIVAIASGRSTGEVRDVSPAPEGTRDDCIAAFRGWHPQIIEALGKAEAPTLWPLYQVTDGGWNQGDDIILIGDAAHAMMPFAAQGAAMAIEDAFELASFISRDLPLAAYVAHRKARIGKVRARGNFNRFAYHARGPVRLGRDLVLSLRRPERLAADFDWLYGYEPQD
ncbi:MULTISPECIES: FAD-dependent monooxygenase [unclassified Rhizobium]|uniref:FAD-dependent monooxygenase n=1 Tax=unclassified Rhizobium TaxID=2613769 RepID=UPI000712F882|nr:MULTISPECIES: FAD-dependent monooxygenase [unclassified Rhizobium]KQS88372.1 salicylate hydroxylase [Rhizobium sp. Leaf391]KQT03963.1 salicylate hydroxylase [Rhizobium sp. Leaf386]KQT95575.1 salicylate hydroxylase [Rhizobium sp. Leaf453]